MQSITLDLSKELTPWSIFQMFFIHIYLNRRVGHALSRLWSMIVVAVDLSLYLYHYVRETQVGESKVCTQQVLGNKKPN